MADEAKRKKDEKYQNDRQELRKMYEHMRKEKVNQMMGLDEIAELTESQILGKTNVNREQIDQMKAKASQR